jgi:hypothetical protein
MSTTPVTISINVVDNNAAAALGKVESELRGVGAAGTAASAQVGGMAAGFDQAGAAGTKMADDFRGVSRTVIGASREMGIGISRYFAAEIMEKFPGLITMVKSLGTAFFALGAIEIGTRMGEGIYNAYEKWLDLNKAERDYIDNLGKAADKEFLNFDSLESAISGMKLLNDQIDVLKNRQEEIVSQPGMDLDAGVDLFGLKKANDQQYANKAKQDQGTMAQLQLEHQMRTQQISDTQKVAEIGAGTYALMAAKEQGAIALAKEELETLQKKNAEYNKGAEIWNKTHANEIAAGTKQSIGLKPEDAGLAEYSQKVITAAQVRVQENIAAARRETTETIALQNRAIDARLQGEALYQSQREQAIAELQRKYELAEISHQALLTRTAAIDLEFDNAKAKRLQEQIEQTEKMAREAQIAGLTGLARIQAEGASRAGDIIAQARKSGDTSQLPQRLSINDQKTQDQQTEAAQAFYEKLRTMNDEWNGSQLQGYARIEAETVRHLDALQKDFQKEFGQLAAADPARVQAEQAVADMTTAAWSNADRERQRLHSETMIGLQKEEVDAARALLPPWAAAQQQIIEQCNERIQKATQEYQQTIAFAKLSAEGRIAAEQDYQAKVQAARQLEAAQMQKQAQQMRDELAGKLGSFFQDPMKFMEKQAESMMMKIIANWVMQLGDFQHNPALQMMFGMGPNLAAPGAGGGGSGLMKMLGAGAHGTSTSLSAPATQLSFAGNTLGTAGNVLIAAASDLSAAASTMGRGGFGGGGWNGGSTSPGGGGFGGGGWGAPSSGAPGADNIGVPGVYSLGGSLSPGGGGSPFSAVGGAASLFSGAAGTVQQALKLGSLIPGIGNAGTSVDPDTGLPVSGAGGMKKLSGGVPGGMAMFGALQGAYQKGSEIKGLIGGAASGASLGSTFMPGIGTAAGAIVGGVAGFLSGMLGFGAEKKAAREYLANTVTPKIDSAMQKYYEGQESYDQAQREIAALEVSEKSHFGKWGKAGSEIWQDDGLATFGTSASLLLRAEEAGRGDVPRGTSEFHSGGYVAGFGPGDLGNGEGLAKLRRGEYIVDADTTAAYRPALESLSSSKTMPMRPASSGGQVHLHVHALDLKDFRGYLRGGGAQEVQAALNGYQGEYAGEADNN